MQEEKFLTILKAEYLQKRIKFHTQNVNQGLNQQPAPTAETKLITEYLH